MIIIIIFPLKSLILLFLTNDSCSFFVLKGLALICSKSLRIQETHFVMGLVGFSFLIYCCAECFISMMYHQALEKALKTLIRLLRYVCSC